MGEPKSCDKCRLRNGSWCLGFSPEDWRKGYNSPPDGERLSECPAVYLPDDCGSLISMERLRSEMDRYIDWCGEMGITPSGEGIWYKLLDALEHAHIYYKADVSAPADAAKQEVGK